MSPAELAERLAPIRLPTSFARLEIYELLAALCVAILLGLTIAGLVRLVTERRVAPEETVESEIDRLAVLAPDARLLGLARLLRGLDPAARLPDGAATALYKPGADGGAAVLEEAVRTAARRAAQRRRWRLR